MNKVFLFSFAFALQCKAGEDIYSKFGIGKNAFPELAYQIERSGNEYEVYLSFRANRLIRNRICVGAAISSSWRTETSNLNREKFWDAAKILKTVSFSRLNKCEVENFETDFNFDEISELEVPIKEIMKCLNINNCNGDLESQREKLSDFKSFVLLGVYREVALNGMEYAELSFSGRKGSAAQYFESRIYFLEKNKITLIGPSGLIFSPPKLFNNETSIEKTPEIRFPD